MCAAMPSAHQPQTVRFAHRSAAAHGHNPGAHQLFDAVRSEQLDQAGYLIAWTRHFDHQRAASDVDNARTVNIRNLHDFGALSSRLARDFDQRQLTLYARILTQVTDL